MPSIKWKLYQFNRKAQRLNESRFIRFINKPKGEELSLDALNREDIEGFILNLRFLIQDQDGFSIHCLSEIYNRLPSEFQEIATLFEQVREHLNSYLDTPTSFILEEETKSNREILNIVLYGDYAHAKPKYWNDLLAITSHELFSLSLFTKFINISSRFNKATQDISVINKEVLSRLKN